MTGVGGAARDVSLRWACAAAGVGLGAGAWNGFRLCNHLLLSGLVWGSGASLAVYVGWRLFAARFRAAPVRPRPLLFFGLVLVVCAVLQNTSMGLRLRVFVAREALAELVEASPESDALPRRVGSFNVTGRRESKGRIYLEMEEDGLCHCGLVFAPGAPPSRKDFSTMSAEVEHLFGPWWKYRTSPS